MATAFPIRNSSKLIPSVGYGCWKVPKETCSNLIEEAIKSGYRHIDCAADYGNEKEVGQGIRNAIQSGLVKREDLWITSKLWNTFHEPQHVKAACQRSLTDLGLDYLDLYLIHFPISLKFVPFETRYPPEWFHDPNAEHPKMELIDVSVQDTWRAMEDLVEQGLVKNIGISNFNCQGIRDVMSYSRIKPVVLQVELHPYLQQVNLVRYAQSLGIHVTAFSPMGHGASYWNDAVAAIREPVIKELASKHGKDSISLNFYVFFNFFLLKIGVTEGQVVLRFGVERGCSVIPKSSNPERIKKNLDLLGFSLTKEDMDGIKGLERNLRFNNPAVFCEQAFNTFCPIFD